MRLFWGDVKWLGIALLPPAFYAFVMQYTGRRAVGEPAHHGRRWPSSRLVTVTLLAIPATHDLVRYYPPEADADPTGPSPRSGPLFWPFLVYADLVLWGATALFVATLLRAVAASTGARACC